jgi:tetratricopeptide (TPR) repeat protein
MSSEKLEETRPTSVAVEPESQGNRPRWWLWALVGVLGVIIVTGVSAYWGYRSGLQVRTDLESTANADQTKEQYELGVRDLDAGLYDVARQRFEYVISLDPNYPGATERLAEVLLALSITATVTPVPTPTLTPTPDLRGAEDLFFQAERLLAEENWTVALETLDTLRQKQPDFRAIDVDGLYFVALRNRGVQKISVDGNLEGGIYDLTRAERFGPLDSESEGWRSWARMYLTGASFWNISWSQAVSVFSELALIAPNIRDTSGWTATERLRQALIRFGDQFANAEDWCNAQTQYEAALLIGPDPNLEPTATQVTMECWTPTPKPIPPTNTPEPSPTEGQPPEPSPTEGQPPESTPTPTPGS